MSAAGSHNLNSKYAWREVSRKELPKRSATDRAADFLEIYGLLDEVTAREQASRCIQCPNPTCVAGCPLCNPIPEWMLLTAEGRFLEAAAVLGSVTNMAEICARLCPADKLCENTCLLESISEPVAIQAVEQFLSDYAFEHGKVDASTLPPNGKKVAIVGSGPGGLACAEQLAKKGYAVTIFDSELIPGGLFVNGTPAFKLDNSIIQRRLDILKKRGVVFRMGAKLGEGVQLEQLRKDFDAVFLGWDARKARELEVPGADLKGVLQALPFLLHHGPALLDSPAIDVKGKRVVVLGGGDTAMDCLRAAIRLGASEVTGVYRREEADMPCSRQEYKNALEEGAKFVFCAAPIAVLGNKRGEVTGLRLIRTEMGLAEDGGPRPYLTRPGTEFELSTDYVVLALGFDPLPCEHTGDMAALAVNNWGGIVVDSHQMTNLAGVFAGGDLVQGPSTVLHVVRDGRAAAAGIDVYLSAKRQPVKK